MSETVTVHVPALELEIRCATCSTTLAAQHNTRTDALIVDPCDKCVSDAREKGIEEGRSESTEE